MGGPASGSFARGLPKTLSRYRLEAPIASGGMGVVYRAWDPKLERHVALKVLQPKRVVAEVINRLLEEARALARLTHPNVLPVYDAGVERAYIWIALELVEGETLNERCKQIPDWRDRLPLFLAAGRGLAASHAAGIVHGDVKPHNILVGNDGRVRVIDFGLARIEAIADGTEDLTSAPSPMVSRGSAPIGTPAYMAPEQHELELPTASSDIYSFCVSLWEGLYGNRPFVADTVWKLAGAKYDLDAVVTPESDVPARIERALRIGLAPESDHRWRSMNELLEHLGTPRRRWGWAVLGLGVIGLGLLPALAKPPADGVECGEDLGDVWNAVRAEALDRKVTVDGKEFASDTSARLTARLDELSRSWSDTYARTCSQDEQLPVSTEEIHECLDVARAEIEAFVGGVLGTENLDPTVMLTLVDAVGRIRDPASCTAPSPRPAPSTKPVDADAARALHREIASLCISTRIGDDPESLIEAWNTVNAEADALGDQSRIAEARFELGMAFLVAGDPNAAVEPLQAAYYTAHAAGYDAMAAHAAVRLAGLYADELADANHADAWLELSNVSLQRHGASPIQSARTGAFRCQVLEVLGRYEEALDACRHAIEQVELADAAGSIVRFEALQSMAMIQVAVGDFATAEQTVEVALEEGEHVLGVNHPSRGRALTTLGLIERNRGDLDSAYTHLAMVVDMNRGAFGERHAETARAQGNLASAAHVRGNLDEASSLYQSALATFRQELGDEHPMVTATMGNLAIVERDQGHFDRARELLLEAIRIEERVLGGTHQHMFDRWNNLGMVTNDMGNLEEALDAYRRALAIAESPDAEVTGQDRWIVHTNLAGVLRGLERPGEALEHDRSAISVVEKLLPGTVLEAIARASLAATTLDLADYDDVLAQCRVLEPLLKHVDAPDWLVGETSFICGSAHWHHGGRKEAVRLVEAAKDALADADASHDETRKNVDAWLAGDRGS